MFIDNELQSELQSSEANDMHLNVGFKLKSLCTPAVNKAQRGGQIERLLDCNSRRQWHRGQCRTLCVDNEVRKLQTDAESARETESDPCVMIFPVQVLQRIDTENMRCTKFVHPSSVHKVNQECQQRMVADHLPFLHGETAEMVQQEKHKGGGFFY